MEVLKMSQASIVNKIPQDVWTTINIAASAQGYGTTYQLFSAILGGTVKLTDTNITTSQRIPYPMIAVYGINVEIFSDSNTTNLPGLDMNCAMQNMSLLFTKLQMKRAQFMLGDCGAGNDNTGSTGIGTATTTMINTTNGVASAANFYPLKNIETFSGNETIGGVLTIENGWTPVTAFKVRVTLKAYAAVSAGVPAGS
jgi:hypothetical protein